MTPASPRRPCGDRRRRAGAGISLVELLVALAVIAVVALALVGLQVTSLKAARGAAQTRWHAALLDFEAGLARVTSPPDGACRTAPETGQCTVSVSCLDEPSGPGGCGLQTIEVVVETLEGRFLSVVTARLAALEAGPVVRPGAAESP